ncbi:MAG: hypothetical protein U1E51_31080, partial [Candidatus Binatia bacterium]|nr:hypothetical protein [Candidatus Binatia bacterium]
QPQIGIPGITDIPPLEARTGEMVACCSCHKPRCMDFSHHRADYFRLADGTFMAGPLKEKLLSRGPQIFLQLSNIGPNSLSSRRKHTNPDSISIMTMASAWFGE